MTQRNMLARQFRGSDFLHFHRHQIVGLVLIKAYQILTVHQLTPGLSFRGFSFLANSDEEGLSSWRQ
jgi:hypothetical protein